MSFSSTSEGILILCFLQDPLRQTDDYWLEKQTVRWI